MTENPRILLKTFSLAATWYSLTQDDGLELCVYCGMRATSIDHYPPVASTPKIGVLLGACKECNTFARDLYPRDFPKRVAHVKKKISTKYAAALRLPVWTLDELDEMSITMREEIVQWQDIKRVTRARLAWDVSAHLQHIVSMRSSALRGAAYDRTLDIVVSLLGLCPGARDRFARNVSSSKTEDD